MPGLFGFVDRVEMAASNEGCSKALEAMAYALRLAPHQKTELFHAHGVGLGCVHIPLQNPEAQPAWNRTRSRCLMWYGEIFETARLRNTLCERGIDCETSSNAELLLQLYEEFGEDFLSHLNGSFIIAIWDCQTQEMIVANDMLGAEMLYYTQYNNRVAFASLVGALMSDARMARRVDPIAILQMISWEMVLGDRTLLQDVHLLPPGSILRIKEGAYRLTRYCRFQFAEEYQFRPRQEYFEEFNRLLLQSIQRQEPGKLRAGINLSGGLDSRIILGLLTTIKRNEPLHSFTFGTSESDDVRLARELAAITKTYHHNFPFKPDFLTEIIERGLQLTDGMSNCVHFHAMTVIDQQVPLVDVVYTGYMGDTILSSEAKMEWIVPYDRKLTREQCVWLMGYVFPNLPLRSLLTPSFEQIAYEAYDAELDRIIDEQKANLTLSALNHFEVMYNGRRNTRYGNDLLRNQLLCRTPFVDRDFVNFCLNLPPGLRLNRLLVKEMINTQFNELGKVPWEKTGLPLVECLRDLKERSVKHFRWHIARTVGRYDLAHRKPRSMHSYGAWMRKPMAEWVKGILLAPSALDRGYLKPEVQTRLVAEHMAGKDNSRELGVLITLELWHRKYID